jgi:hypothetical protein
MFSGLQNRISETFWVGNSGEFSHSKHLVVKTKIEWGKDTNHWYQWHTIATIGNGIAKITLLERDSSKYYYLPHIKPDVDETISTHHKSCKLEIAQEFSSMRNRILQLNRVGESFSSVSFNFGKSTALFQNNANIIILVYNRNSVTHKAILMVGNIKPFILFSWENHECDFDVFDTIIKTII